MSEEVVKVLYNYSYTDEKGLVTIKEGDVYRLVEKTNDEWWQVYNPADDEGESFFVPAQYIQIVSEVSPWKTLSDFDKALLTESNRHSPTPDYESDETENQQPLGRQRFASAPPPSSETNGDPEGDYVNLDVFRVSAGISQPPLPGTGNEHVKSASDPPKQLVPLELIKGTVPPPLPEEGSFIEVLMKGLPWDVYREHVAGRRYYVNRETGERMWKPPRKEKVTTPTSTTSQDPLTSPLSPKREDCVIPEEFEQVQDNGNLYFIHKSNKEKKFQHLPSGALGENIVMITKWKKVIDPAGRPYFHKLGTSITQWYLPSSTSKSVIEVSDSDQAVKQRDVAWEPQGPRLSTFGGQSVRTARPVSTFGHLESSNVGTNKASKASTLPAKLNAPNDSTIHDWNPLPSVPASTQPNSLPTSVSTGSLPSVSEEVYGSYLNRKKIADTGKKKVKKNWGQIYVVLQGSNLIFYKDIKSAFNTPGTPHGIPEGVVSLQGAQVDFNPSKDITSKKNVIMLSASSGITFLFQSDNEKTIREWLTRMKIVANDVSENSSRSFDVKEDKKGLARSLSSVEESSGGHEKKSYISIKAKLFNFFSLRPTQEDLIKRGIIKDAVFGSHLNELCDKEKTHVPHFVHNCIQAVEFKGLNHDGMYRVSGNMAEIQRLRYAVDKDDKCNLYDEQWDVHVLTGSLKLFFRELKEPVFPFHMYNKFIDAIKKDSKKEKMSSMKSAVSNLPRCNYHTLKELFQHLSKVVELSHQNRMESQNVAIVFGPTLLWPEKETGSLALHTVFQSKIVEFILIEYSELFK